MSTPDKEALLRELKSIRERETEILAELFAEVTVQEADNKRTKPTSSGPLQIGDRVRLLSGGITSSKGDTGVIIKVTQKRYEIKVDRNKAIVKKAFHSVQAI